MSRRVSWLQITGGGIVMAGRLVSGARDDSVVGLISGPDGTYFRARVRAAPEKGKANVALITLIANWLCAPKSAVGLKAGGQSRLKLITVQRRHLFEQTSRRAGERTLRKSAEHES